MKNMTYADLALEVEKKQKKYQGVLDSKDSTELQRSTADRNLKNLNAYAEEVFSAMEQDKQIMGIPEQPKMAAYGYNGEEDERRTVGPTNPQNYSFENYRGWNSKDDLVPITNSDGSVVMMPKQALTNSQVPGYSINPFTLANPSAQLGPLGTQMTSNAVSPQSGAEGQPGGQMVIQTPKGPMAVPAGQTDANGYPILQKGNESNSGYEYNARTIEPGSNAAGYIIPGINMARGLFEKTDTIEPWEYMSTRKATPMRMDIAPQLESVDANAAIARRNVRTAGPTQTMAGNIAVGDSVARQKAGIYSNKWNADLQDRSRVDATNAQTDADNKKMKLSIRDMNNQSKAAKDNLLQTGMSQALENYYRGRADKMTAEELTLQDKQFGANLKANKEQFDKDLGERQAYRKQNMDMFNKQLEFDKASMNELYKSSNTQPTGATGAKPNYTINAQQGVGYAYNRKPIDHPGPLTPDDVNYIEGLRDPEQFASWVLPTIQKLETGKGSDVYNEASGAAGLYQIMPWTASDNKLKIHPELEALVAEQRKNVGTPRWNELAKQISKKSNELYKAGKLNKDTDERFDPDKEKEAATRIIGKLAEKHGYDLDKVLAAYNGGTEKVNPTENMVQETKDYIAAAKSYGFNPVKTNSYLGVLPENARIKMPETVRRYANESFSDFVRRRNSHIKQLMP